MSFIQNFFTSRDNQLVEVDDQTGNIGNTFVGQTSRLWYNPDDNSIYVSDGSTPGGVLVAGAGGGNPFNQTLNTYNDVEFANLTVTGNVNFNTTGNLNLGNLVVNDQTISGTINNRDISLSPQGTGTLRTLNGIGVYQGDYATFPLFSINTDGVVSTLVPNATSYLGAFELVGNPTGATVAPQNYGTMLHITGVPTVPARIYNDSVANYAAVINRRYNGTSDAPTPVLNNQIFSRVGGTPYLDNGGVGEWPERSTTRFDFVATEDQTTTAQGSKMQFYTVANGDDTPTLTMELDIDTGIKMYGDILPSLNNTFSLGNTTRKWANLFIGPDSIFIEDTVLHTDAELNVTNGVFYSNGVSAFQVGNMQMTTEGLRLTTASTGSDINVGELTDTGYMHLQMPGIKFKDDTIQTTAAIPLAQKGAASGVVPLNASTKIDPIYLPAGGVTFKGIWDAATNSPTLADGTGNVGDEYVVGVAGTRNLGSGSQTFSVGDFVLYTSGNIWVDVPTGGSGVQTFNGRTGIVTLLSGDVTNALSNGSITNNYLNTDSWELVVGQGIGLTGNATVELGDSITLTNTGVTAAIGGTGVSVSAATGNVTFNIGQAVGTANSVQFSSVTATTTIAATGNITGGNIATGGRIVATGNIVTGANIVTPGTVINSSVSTTGNVIGGNIVGQNLTAGRVAIVGSGKEVTTDADFTYNSTTNVLSVAGNVNAAYFNGNIVATGNLSTTGNVIGAYGIFTSGNTVINSGVSTTGNVTGSYIFGNGSQLTGVITSILPTTLSSTVHIAANTVGNTATIITDATTATVANTIVVRDSTGGINVSNWSINARTTATSITLTTTDYWIGCTAKNLTITLPNAANGAVQGRQYLIVDCVQSGAPGDTIATEAGATVVGGSLSQQGQSKTCVFIAATNTWYCN